MKHWQVRFFSIWTGQAFSLLGSALVSFALIWHLTETTNSEGVLATATLMTILPPVLLGPFAGAFVDRWSRRAVMIGADALIALFTAMLALLFWLGTVQVWHIYALLFLRALGGAFHGPAMMASTPRLAPESQLTRIGGMNQALRGVLRIGAPPLGALLLKIMPMQGILAIDVITAALAILPLLFFTVPGPERKAGATPTSFFGEVAAGFTYVWDWRPLFVVVATCTLANIFLGPTMSFQPLLITREFGGDALSLGLVASISGVGLVAGGFFMTLWGGFKRRLVTSAAGWVGVGVGYILITFLPDAWFGALLAIFFAVAFSAAVGMAPLDAFYQACVTPDKQGRVFAVLNAVDQLTMPFGLLLAIAVGERVPLRTWWLLVGVSHAALGFAWLVLPIIRQAEEPRAEALRAEPAPVK